MIDLTLVMARELVLRMALLGIYPGEATRGAKWLRMRQ